MRSENKFGINMKQWCRDHERDVVSAMDEGRVTRELTDGHKERIKILQHERLIHLIVTVMVVFVELFVVYLALLHPQLGILPAIIMLCLAVLLGFYFYHYFFLENTVQRWYKITEELEKLLKK